MKKATKPANRLVPVLFLIVFAGFMTFLVSPDTLSDACASFVFFSFFPLMGIMLTAKA